MASLHLLLLPNFYRERGAATILFSPAGSNHVSFLLVLWRPFGFSREDGVGENDEFAGDGYDGAQVILSVLTQAGVERGEIRIVP
ncbi:hypothetical protein, partial [Rhizobium lentis]